MIDKSYNKYILVCDNCLDTDGEIYDSFEDVLETLKGNEWKTLKENEEWVNLCKDCQ